MPNAKFAMDKNPLLEKGERTVKRYGMLSEGDKVLVGVSGGSDSVFLLYLLYHLKEKYRLSLHIAHLNHGFRPKEAEKEAYFVKGLARSLGISCTVRKVDVPSYAREKRLSRQEAARDVRYSFMRKVSNKRGANKIALGHTADDQAETFLMRMIRGTGATGLGGIQPCSEFTVHGSRFTIIRPLIEIGRNEIIRYLKKKGIPFVEDPSNLSRAYMRNRIRNELIPFIEKDYNPRVKETFVRSAEILREEDSFLELYAKRLLPELVSFREKGRIEIFLDPFLHLDKAIQRRLVRIIIEELRGALKGYSMDHINKVIDSIARGRSGRRINLPNGVIIQRDYDNLSFYLKESGITHQASRHCDINIPGITSIPQFGLTFHAEIREPPIETYNSQLTTNETQAYFDLDKIPEKIQIRKREEGDLFYPLGMGGRSKKLKRYFIDKKIRRDERDRIPLLISGNNILWVIGHRQDERYKVGEDTKKVLLIKAKRGVHGHSW